MMHRFPLILIGANLLLWAWLTIGPRVLERFTDLPEMTPHVNAQSEKVHTIGSITLWWDDVFHKADIVQILDIETNTAVRYTKAEFVRRIVMKAPGYECWCCPSLPDTRKDHTHE
jgi:hypothetical protein